MPNADGQWVAAALAAVVTAGLLLAAGRDRQRRAWALIAVAGTALYVALNTAGRLLPGMPLAQADWNWDGSLLALAGMVALAGLLGRRLGLLAKALGLARPSRLPEAALVTAAGLLATYALNRYTGGRLDAVSVQTWLYLATMPGLVEEFAFRGVLLAAAERAAPASRTIAGARISVGAALLTLAFVALHGATPGTLVSVLPAAVLYLWLRVRTGSVFVPAVTHNLWNLTVLLAHL